MYIEKTTAAERLIVASTVYSVMTYVTNARRLLMRVLDTFFDDAKQKPIDSYDAESIGDILHAINDALWWAETEYALTVGDENAPGCESCYEGAKRALLVRDVERLREKVGCSETKQYLDLRDEELLPILQELAKKKGADIKGPGQ